MTRVLVTGATGQDGSYLIDQLAEKARPFTHSLAMAARALTRCGSDGRT